ncbi:sensor histidine kinase [Undibacterium sp. TJN19]|uniref:sensor histidine kinase n=1 Tax=Undibacterium sp. TJN19 TaxID=3413055 RepID=UPI003BF435C9
MKLAPANPAKPAKPARPANTSTSSKEASDHPLALIPIFRRWQPGILRDLVYTFILGLGFALFFFSLYAYNLSRDQLAAQLWNDLVIAMSISYSIHLLFGLSSFLLGPELENIRGWKWAAYYTVVPSGGVFAGYFLAVILINPAALHLNFFKPGVIFNFAIISMLVSCVLLFAYLIRERELLDKEKIATEQRRALESERRALEAQLRMLQAQIEPHFLYNTLANAVGLIAPDPARARLLLERLIDYLRATLSASRDSDTLLQSEIDTITAYLELMKLRMGERLRYRIELADEALKLPIPPMLLQPVVENAISHGLEPKIEGGEILLKAHLEVNHLHVVISDTGVGFQTVASSKPGGGVGLSNLRERIAALYGKQGSLNITENAAGGVSVSLYLPLPSATLIQL